MYSIIVFHYLHLIFYLFGCSVCVLLKTNFLCLLRTSRHAEIKELREPWRRNLLRLNLLRNKRFHPNWTLLNNIAFGGVSERSTEQAQTPEKGWWFYHNKQVSIQARRRKGPPSIKTSGMRQVKMEVNISSVNNLISFDIELAVLLLIYRVTFLLPFHTLNSHSREKSPYTHLKRKDRRYASRT